MDRIEAIKKELKDLEEVSTCAYNNDGLFNEIRNMQEKLKVELEKLLKEQNDESKKNG